MFSERGCDYELAVTYRTEGYRRLFVAVNGQSREVTLDHSAKGMAETAVTVMLEKGYNTVEMYSPYTWIPDIDKFELRRL